MGEVYRARDTRLDRTVAIKVLLPEAHADAERRARFMREARAIAHLNHPHICTLYDVGEAALPAAPPRTRADVSNGSAGASSFPGSESEAPGASSSASSVSSPALSLDEPRAATPYLVMECLVGESLAQRLERGALPLMEALNIGAQIAEALEVAHRAGIVHRDLKPSNVMLTTGGAAGAGAPQVKLLDFGLAKLRETAPVSTDASTATVSGDGIRLGTLPYMAPEQVEGKEADARTDVFALGAVLYEMLTGRRAFTGANAARLASAILTKEPTPLTTMVSGVPVQLEHVVARCLAKDPDARWQSAGDVRRELQWIRESAPTPRVAAPSRSRWLYAAVAAAIAVVALGSLATGLWIRPLRPVVPGATVVRSLLDVGPADELNGGGAFPNFVVTRGGSRTAMAWSPDGQALVFVGRRGGRQHLYVRRLDANEARLLPSTDNAQVPAVSPDGKWVAFWADGAIKKVPIDGGPTSTMVSDAGLPKGMCWDQRGYLYFDNGPILVIPPDGTPAVVTTVADDEQLHVLPQVLPDGETLLYTVRRRMWTWGDEEIVAHTLATGRRRVLLRDAADARYLTSGHLVFLRRGELLAVPFDAERVAVRGMPQSVLDGVAQGLTNGNAVDNAGAGQFAVAPTGTLAWVPGPVIPYRLATLVAVDRRGRVSPLGAPDRSYSGIVRVSPDGRRLLVSVLALTEVGLWEYDLGRGALTPLRLGGEALFPLWSPDGAAMVFSWLSKGRRSIAIQPPDSTAAPTVLADGALVPSSLTPDGRRLIAFPPGGHGATLLTLGGASATAEPFLQPGHIRAWAVFSPDGRWVAYGSDTSGRDEVYVRPYPGPGPARQVSVDGGYSPLWHPGGRELFFIRGIDGDTGELMTAAFEAGPPMRIGVPERLFDIRRHVLGMFGYPARHFDVSLDGRLFYTVRWQQPFVPPPVTHIHLIQNWVEDLKTKVPGAESE